VSADPAKAEFARRLQAALVNLGWNQSELARRMAPHLPRNSIARDNISKYIRGKVLPSPHVLEAMCKVLDKKPSELLPSRAAPSVRPDRSPLHITDLGGGQAWLEINQAVPWPIALDIINRLKGANDDAVGQSLEKEK
jgi:transcriptional regulator with XRE-family HTH domain